MDDATAAMVEYVVSLRIGSIPSAVLSAAKRCILDTLMVARAGARAEGVAEMLGLVRAESCGGKSTVWGNSCALPPGSAALVNATAAAALDYDSLCLTVHADAVVVPAVFAVAEALDCSGEDLLTAHIAGVELIVRLSHASVPPQKGWSHTAIFGVFGAAVAAARLLRLTPAQMTNALGICLSMASGSQQANIEQALTKRLQPALAARNGIFAAYAAQAGITGPASIIEGKNGLWALYQAGDRNRLLSGLGRDYVLTQTGIKKYPICACSHAAVEACLELTAGKPLHDAKIEVVEVTLTPFMAYMVGADFAPAGDPVVTAQFSVRYAIACALLRGNLSVADLATDAIMDPDIGRLARRIVVRTDQAATGELAPATVHLRTTNGETRSRTIAAMPGGAQTPLSSREMEQKLAACEQASPFAARADGLPRLRQMIDCLEHQAELTNLNALLKTPAAVGRVAAIA